MAIQTVGQHQMHLIARQISGTPKWAAYIMIERFDAEAGNFKCVRERERVGSDETLFDSEDAAEEAARQYGNTLLASGRL